MNMKWGVGLGATFILVALPALAVAQQRDGLARSRDQYSGSMHQYWGRDSADDARPSWRRRSPARDDSPYAGGRDRFSRRAAGGRFGSGRFGPGGPPWLRGPWFLENRAARFGPSRNWRDGSGRRYRHGFACRHRHGYGHRGPRAWDRGFRGPWGWGSRFGRHHGRHYHGRRFGRRAFSGRWHGGYWGRWHTPDDDR